MRTASSSASWQSCWISSRFSRRTFSFSTQATISPDGERHMVSGRGRELMSSGALEEILDFVDGGGAALRETAPQDFAQDHDGGTVSRLERKRRQFRQRPEKRPALRKRCALDQRNRRARGLAPVDQLGADASRKARAHVDDGSVGGEHARGPVVVALALRRPRRDESDVTGEAAAS